MAKKKQNDDLDLDIDLGIEDTKSKSVDNGLSIDIDDDSIIDELSGDIGMNDINTDNDLVESSIELVNHEIDYSGYDVKEVAPLVYAISNIMNLDRITKDEIGKMASALAVQIGDNNLAVRFKVLSAAISEFINGVTSNAQFKAYLSDEVSRYGKDDSFYRGVEFTQTKGTEVYSYNHDDVWVDIFNKVGEQKKVLEEIESKLKERETFLKANKGITFEENGKKKKGAILVPGAGQAESARFTIPKK